jgi:hypothetical protein
MKGDELKLPLNPKHTFPLNVRFYSVLRLKVMENAVRLDTESFRVQFKDPDVYAVFKRNRAVLRKVFAKYATLASVAKHDDDQGTTKWTQTIDYEEFMSLLKDFKLLNQQYLNQQVVYSLFANIQHNLHPGVRPRKPRSRRSSVDLEVQQQKREESHEHDPGTELIFPEFLEGLAAVACFRHPDPYSPISERLDYFFEKDFLPMATQKNCI